MSQDTSPYSLEELNSLLKSLRFESQLKALLERTGKGNKCEKLLLPLELCKLAYARFAERLAWEK